ncbi:MAG TPA: hypothetical protein VFZ66_04505 [Herpetosiphonaceae bacterium]
MRTLRIMMGTLSASLLILSFLAFAPQQHTHHQATHHGGATWHATWLNHPESLAQAEDLATAIVVAQVTKVTQAPDIVPQTKGDAAQGQPKDGTHKELPKREGEAAVQHGAPDAKVANDPLRQLPNQRISFKVLQSLKGDVGETLRLFHTGNDTQFIEGDPPYKAGEIYVLFVQPRQHEAATYRVISPEGRYQVVDGKLQPMVTEGFAAQLEGTSVDSLAAELAR